MTIIELRTVSDAQARKEILAQFNNKLGTDMYYGALSEELALPVEQVVSICNELEDEGLIVEGVGF
jgi:hypothetical protein